MPAVRVVQADGAARADRPVADQPNRKVTAGTTTGMCPACGVGKVSAPHGGNGGNVRYGSVCSGIEAATVAWHGLGWAADALKQGAPAAVKQSILALRENVELAATMAGAFTRDNAARLEAALGRTVAESVLPAGTVSW